MIEAGCTALGFVIGWYFGNHSLRTFIQSSCDRRTCQSIDDFNENRIVESEYIGQVETLARIRTDLESRKNFI